MPLHINHTLAIKSQPGTADVSQMFGFLSFGNRLKRIIKKKKKKEKSDSKGLPENTLGILVRKLFTVRIGMPFCSCCIRAITSSICATQEQRETKAGKRKRKRKSHREYFSLELESVKGVVGEQMDGGKHRWASAVSNEPTLLSGLSFPASKLRRTCTGSGLQQQQEHKRNEKLLSRTNGTTHLQKQTLTHLTETHMGAVSGVQQGTHGNHGSKNTPRGEEQTAEVEQSASKMHERMRENWH